VGIGIEIERRFQETGRSWVMHADKLSFGLDVGVRSCEEWRVSRVGCVGEFVIVEFSGYVRVK
jgi:hypothetical protein